jgi:hypothetical protein
MMKVKSNRVKERTKIESLLAFLHEHAYVETMIIVSMYLLVGYAIDPNDICILDGEISYILILLAVITLFHGFENGMLTLAILAVAIWLTYPLFQYIEFLVALLMTMIFSEFHYYWTQKIKNAETNAEYRGTKLDELSKAFYTLKISHDQLEKNYVIKPMSIRNSIEFIISKHLEIDTDNTLEDKKKAYYENFLLLLEKSFNVSSAAIVYKVEDYLNEYITEENSNIVINSKSESIELDEFFGDHLVDKAIERGTAIYISDALGEPTTNSDGNSQYLAAIPAMHKGKAVAVLVIKKMPFMSFNREILTSLSILLEYFTVEIRKQDVLCVQEELRVIKDESFRFEYYRLKNLYDNYKVNSIALVLRIDNELQAVRIYDKIEKMLRSLDMVTIVKENELYYITLLFPLHDKAAAIGYLNRLLNYLDESKDKEFNYMTFNLSQTELLNKYLSEDYSA